MGLGKTFSRAKKSTPAAVKTADGQVGGAGVQAVDVVEDAGLGVQAPDVVTAALASGHAGDQDGDGPVQDVGPGEGGAEPAWQLTGSWLQRARDELHEDPANTAALLDRLRGLVQEDTGLRARCDDAFLVRFLRARKFNVAKAHKTLQRYYQMKRKHPNLFRADGVDRLDGMLDAEMHGVLEGRDADGCPVLTIKIDKYDAAVHTVDDFFRLNVVALEQVVRDPETQVSGINVVVDLNGFGIQHASFLAPYYVKNTSEVIQESFPLRFKGFHVLNQPFYFAALFAVVRPFLKEKIKRRVALHGTRFDALHKVVPKDMLPQQYGGPPAGFQHSRWAAKLRALAGYFTDLESFGYPGEEAEAEGRRRLSLFSTSRRQSAASTDGKAPAP